MAFDVKALVDQAIETLKKDPTLLKKFKTEPVKVLEKILDVDLPDDAIAQVAKAVQTKIDLDKLGDFVEDLDADKLGDALGKLKKLF